MLLSTILVEVPAHKNRPQKTQPSLRLISFVAHVLQDQSLKDDKRN